MKRDPHIESYRESPPLMPWTATRFRWPDKYDPDVETLRSNAVQDGQGLFILKPPHDFPRERLLVEAYYGRDIRPEYHETVLDPMRKSDARQGKLVVIHVHDNIKPPGEPLDMRHIREINRNARNARSHLKRQSNAGYRQSEIESKREAEDREVYSRFAQIYTEARMDTRRHILQPRSGPTGARDGLKL